MMLKKINGAQDACRTAYMCFLVVYMVVREVMPLQILINHTLLSAAIFGFGLLLVVWDLFTQRDCLKGRAIDGLVVFLIIAAISCVIQYRYGIVSNIKCLIAMVLEYFVFFPMGLKKDGKKTLCCLFDTLIITTFVFVLISVLMYVFSIDYSIVSAYGSGDQGYDSTWGRLWGVFGDPNVACYFSLATVFASAFLLYQRRTVWGYVWYGLSVLVQMTFIMLSLSRSGLLLMLAIPVLSSVYVFLAFIRTDKKRAFGGVLAMVLVSAVLYGGYTGLMHGMPYVKAAVLNGVGESGRSAVETAYDQAYAFFGVEVIGAPEEPDTDDDPDNPDDTTVEVEKIERKDEKDDYSNGRFARWKGGIEVFKTTPIFGTSPRNAVAIAKERTPDTVMGKYGWVTHCSYLEVLVNTGILGAVAMFGCLIFIAVRFLRASLKNGFDHHVFATLLCFITIAAGAFFVSDVFFVFSINALLFFYLLGYLYRYTEDENGLLAKLFTALTKGKRHETDSDLRS